MTHAPRTTLVLATCLVVLFVSRFAAAQPMWKGPDPVIGVGGSEPPAVATGGPNRIDLVYTNQLGNLYWQWKDTNGNYTSPADLSNVGATSPPGIVANARNRLDAFYRGANGHLWTSWWDGTWWSGGVDLGGEEIATSAPMAIANGPHKLDVYYLNSAGQLTISWWDGGPWWSAPEHFTLIGVRAPVAVTNMGPHKVDVVYRGSDDHLWTFWTDGGPWSAAEPLDVRVTSNPSIATTRQFRRFDGVMIDCSWWPFDLTGLCKNRARLFFGDFRGELCWRDSVGGGSWHSINTCGSVPAGEKLVAVSVTEVIFMGQKTPIGNSPTATMRVYE